MTYSMDLWKYRSWENMDLEKCNVLIKWLYVCSLSVFQLSLFYEKSKQTPKTWNSTYLKSVNFRLASGLFYTSWPLSKRLSHSILCFMPPSIKHYFLEASLPVCLSLCQLSLFLIPFWSAVSSLLLHPEHLSIINSLSFIP